MKKLILLLSLFAFSYSNCQNAGTRLIISTNVNSSYIFVGDKLAGMGKAELDVKEGEYNICIKESLTKWSAGTITDLIKITRNEGKVERHYALPNTVLINSTPQNARIAAGDSTLGFTPAFINADYKNLILTKENFMPLEVKLPGKAEFDLGTPLNGKNGSFTKSPWFKILLGSAAVLGTVAAYYKIKADKNYDSYLTNQGSASLDDVNRYDTISGIALGALQINFGVLLYFLLTE